MKIETPLKFISKGIYYPCFFEEKRGDMVFGFPWCMVCGSKFVVGTL